MLQVTSIANIPSDEPLVPALRPLSRWEEVAKSITIWVARACIFMSALILGGVGAAFGLFVGGHIGMFILGAVFGGSALATAWDVHDKAMKWIERYFEKRRLPNEQSSARPEQCLMQKFQKNIEKLKEKREAKLKLKRAEQRLKQKFRNNILSIRKRRSERLAENGHLRRTSSAPPTYSQVSQYL